jgi:hypothetical protein
MRLHASYNMVGGNGTRRAAAERMYTGVHLMLTQMNVRYVYSDICALFCGGAALYVMLLWL